MMKIFYKEKIKQIIEIYSSLQSIHQMISFFTYYILQILFYLIIINMQNQQKQVKLIKSQNSQQEYAILIHQQIGRGGFGVVKRAFNLANKKQKLAVKIMTLADDSKRTAIQKQLKIMNQLPDNQNLVKVKPIKCFSTKNYYIFMQYCQGGTLYQQAKNKKYTQFQILNIFYQVMNGYKALFDKKILHQDLKPQNILIKNGVYKLADFGLSIFYEGYKYTNKRQGTLNYIALEKLTKRQYFGNHKSDIYSLGVIMFEIIVGNHPYIVNFGPNRDMKNFLTEFKNSKINLPMGFMNKFTLEFNRIFDIILSMIQKNEASRISFGEIWNMIESNQLFKPFKSVKNQKNKSEEYDKYNLIIAEVSNVYTLPVNTSQFEQKGYKQKLIQQYDKKQRETLMKVIKQIEQFLIGHRIIMYYLDRLARRIIVEQLKTSIKSINQDKVIFQIMLANRSILNVLIKEIQNPKIFKIKDWKLFRQNQFSYLIEMIKKDDKYIQESTCDFLAQSSKITKSQLREILQIYKLNDLKKLLQFLIQNLKSLFKQRTTNFIEIKNRNALLTLNYIIFLNEILERFNQYLKCPNDLEMKFRNLETESTSNLYNLIALTCQRQNIVIRLDLSQCNFEQID